VGPARGPFPVLKAEAFKLQLLEGCLLGHAQLVFAPQLRFERFESHLQVFGRELCPLHGDF
jgi:hypothetical protein